MQVPHYPRLVAVLLLIGLVAALVVVPPAIGWETADSGGTVSEPAPEETQGAEPAAEAAPEEHADGADADLGIMDQSSQAAAEATQAEAPPPPRRRKTTTTGATRTTTSA